MNDGFVTALTRRASLMTLGTAGMVALVRPFAADAKKKPHKKKGDVNKLCKTQIEPCIRLQLPACGDGPVCKLALQRCCQFFGTCDFAGFTTCLIDASH